MVALQLFDVLSSYAVDSTATEDEAKLRGVSARLIESYLAEWRQIREIDQETLPSPWDDRIRAMEISRAMHSLHSEWAENVESLLARLRKLPSAADANKIEELEDA